MKTGIHIQQHQVGLDGPELGKALSAIGSHRHGVALLFQLFEISTSYWISDSAKDRHLLFMSSTVRSYASFIHYFLSLPVISSE